MTMFDNSLMLALKDAYPKHNWQIWRFRGVSSTALRSMSLHDKKQFTKWAEEQLAITTLDGSFITPL
jgi:hypothetical protein